MEVTGLLLGTAQAVVQLAGVVKRHVVAYSSLESLAKSVEAKAQRCCGVAEELTQFTVPGFSAKLFSHTLDDLEEIRDALSHVDQQVEYWKSIGTFLQAPVLNESLKEIDVKLIQVEYFFRTVGILGSLICSEERRSTQELRELIVSTGSAVVTASVDIDEGRRCIQQLHEQLTFQQHSPYPTVSPVHNAEAFFNMGLAEYGLQPGVEKPFGHRAEPHKISCAARHFYKACSLGKKEAFRYLGDMYYDGEGVETCYRTAVHMYQEGAARNDAAAKFRLGRCFEFGHGVPVRPSKCVRFVEEAADGNCGDAMVKLAALKLHGKMVPYNYSEAYRLLQKAEKMNVFLANDALAKCYLFGLGGVERDPIKACDLFRTAFDGGDYSSTIPLAESYDLGVGVKKDPERATRIYEKCMESGTFFADFYKAYYGLRLVQGKGIEKNTALGKAIILDSNKSGSAISWHALAEIYRHGWGVTQDFNQAKKFYLRAIGLKNGVQGIARSYRALGEMFELGLGVLPDTRRASKYYLSAAEQLNQDAQWKVANAFETGIGQKKNTHRAVYFFKLCANSGHVQGQRKAVLYYMKGHGLERSRVYVRRMIEEEAKQGNKEAKRWIQRESRRGLGMVSRWLTK